MPEWRRENISPHAANQPHTSTPTGGRGDGRATIKRCSRRQESPFSSFVQRPQPFFPRPLHEVWVEGSFPGVVVKVPERSRKDGRGRGGGEGASFAESSLRAAGEGSPRKLPGESLIPPAHRTAHRLCFWRKFSGSLS